MARRSRYHSKGTRRRRRSRPCDVIPLNLCGDGFLMNPGATTCDNVTSAFFPLIDGSALNRILRSAAIASGDTEAYYDSQAVSRGCAFLGAEFWMRMSLTDQPTNFATGPAITSWRINCALVKLQWSYTNVDVPVLESLPNLFSRDEKQVHHILHRWSLYCGPWVILNETDPNYVGSIEHIDTQGGQAMTIQTTGHGGEDNWFSQLTELGQASSNQTHHRIRNRRKVDESEVIGLLICAMCPFQFDDQYAFNVDLNGFMKAKQL